MNRSIAANILPVLLLIISSLFLFLFLAKESLFSGEQALQKSTYNYLADKFQLMESFKLPDRNAICEQQKTPQVQFLAHHFVDYQFACENVSIFIQPKPTQKKYITFTHLEDLLDIATFDDRIYKITSLSELPPSSQENPQIAIALNAIDESLTSHFYGLIITEYYFDVKGKKIYGALYSSYDNQREERNIVYRSKVIDNIEKQFSHWYYLPYSRNLLHNETTH